MQIKHIFSFSYFGILFLAYSISFAQSYPNWWDSKNVIDPQLPSNDYGVANQGQTKWFAL